MTHLSEFFYFSCFGSKEHPRKGPLSDPGVIPTLMEESPGYKPEECREDHSILMQVKTQRSTKKTSNLSCHPAVPGFLQKESRSCKDIQVGDQGNGQEWWE